MDKLTNLQRALYTQELTNIEDYKNIDELVSKILEVNKKYDVVLTDEQIKEVLQVYDPEYFKNIIIN